MRNVVPYMTTTLDGFIATIRLERRAYSPVLR